MDIIFRNIEGFDYIHPDVEGAEVSEDIIITASAMDVLVKQLNENIKKVVLYEDNFFIRFGMLPAEIGAKQYSIKIDNIINDFDRVFELKKIKIIIDNKSLFYFMGIIVDYVKYNDTEGFVFLDISDPKVIDYYRGF
ncbi:MAG: hypothetical protein FWG85_02720 [Bacteroidetes bacterium]|nr:hypothetical protein [Bacteroidota bacterium]